MAKTIYDKPTRALLKDMIAAWALQPGQVFTSSRAIEWFATNYPKLKPGSIRAHLVQASTNDRSRLHHPATNASDDLLFKVASGQFRLFEPGKDPAPIHELVEGDVARQEQLDWVRKDLAEPGQRVRGIIVCRTMSEDLRLACAGIPNVELFEYRLSVSVTRIPALELPQ